MTRRLAFLGLLPFLLAAKVKAQDVTSIGGAIGPALWVEISGESCERDGDVEACTLGGVQDVFVGARGSFDANILRWLRLGLSVDLALGGDRSERVASGGLRETQRHWLVPMGIYVRGLVDLRERLTLWGGPELAYGLRVDQRTRYAPGSELTDRDARSGFLAGFAVGLDVRMDRSWWIGFELGESLSLATEQRLPRPRPSSTGPRAITRLALVLRFL